MGAYDFLLNGAQGVQVPDQVAQAQKFMSLAAIANQNQLAQYNLQSAQRKDAAATGLGQALGGLDINDDAAVMRAINGAPPDARAGIYDQVLKMRKEAAEAGFKKSEAGAKDWEVKKGQAAVIGNLANYLANKPDVNQQDVMAAAANVKALGLDPSQIIPPQGVDPRAHWQALAGQAMDAVKQMELQGQAATRQETNRHNTTEEQLTGSRDTNTANYQRGELGIKGAELQNSSMRARAAMVTADPFGLSGLNTGAGGGAPSAPAAPGGGMVIPPDVQAQRDAQAYQMLIAERNKAPDMQTAAQLDRELQARFPKGPPTVGAPQPGGAPAAPTGGPTSVQGAIQAGLHGDEFLASLPPQIAGMVKGLADGRTPFPTGAAMRSPQVQQLISLVSQYDPNFDAVNYAARNKTRSSFAAGKDADVTAALNQLAGHIDRFQTSSAALNNGPFPWLNQAENAIGPQLGKTNLDARLKQYGTDRQAVIAEAERVFRGTGGSESDLQRWKSNFDSSSSPEAQQAAITELAHLISSRIDAQVTKYQSGMGTTARALPALTPAAAATYRKLGIDVSADTAPAPGGKQSAAPAGIMVDQLPDPASVPKGTRIRDTITGKEMTSDGKDWR